MKALKYQATTQASYNESASPWPSYNPLITEAVMEPWLEAHRPYLEAVRAADHACIGARLVSQIRDFLDRTYGPDEYPTRLAAHLERLNQAADKLYLHQAGLTCAWDWGFPDAKA